MKNMKRMAAMTLIGVVLSGSALAKDLPKPDADDPALAANGQVTEDVKAPETGAFTKAAEMASEAHKREVRKDKEDVRHQTSDVSDEAGWKKYRTKGGTVEERNRADEIVRYKEVDKAGRMKLEKDEILLHGQIVGYESVSRDETLALFETDDGKVQRIQLGKHGGRLLKLTPFDVKGVMKRDETGDYLDVTAVDYLDPDPFGEYYDTSDKLAKAKGEMARKGAAYKRDAAYSHDNITSDDPTTLMQHSKVVNREDYAVTSSYGLKDLEAGTKVALTGRCVMTIDTEKDLMEFWDKDMKRATLKMNGIYVPLGQRCTILGVLQDDGTVSVDAMTSVE